MRIRLAILSFLLVIPTSFARAEEPTPKIAVAYDIGFKGDGGFNDAVSGSLSIAQRRFNLVAPFVREIPTSGTPVDRLSKLRFLAKNGYTLIISVGSGYRETVRRVSIEFPETQFALINDNSIGQLNVSNVYFDEIEAARIAGTIARVRSKTKVVAIISASPEISKAFTVGAKGVEVLNVPFVGDVTALNLSLQRADIVYSLWDSDARVYETVLNRTSKTLYIARNPDQYFASLKSSTKVIAVIEKNLQKPIAQLVKLALEDRALIDVINEESGIFGRKYGVKNGGITYRLRPGQTAVEKALRALKG